MTVQTDTDTAEVSWDLEVSDDNGMFTLVSTGAQSGDTFGVGTSVISYTATDNALNSASCTFRVIIEGECEPLSFFCMLVVKDCNRLECRLPYKYKYDTNTNAPLLGFLTLQSSESRVHRSIGK